MIFYMDFFFLVSNFLILGLNFSFVTLSIVQFIKVFRVNILFPWLYDPERIMNFFAYLNVFC